LIPTADLTQEKRSDGSARRRPCVYHWWRIRYRVACSSSEPHVVIADSKITVAPADPESGRRFQVELPDHAEEFFAERTEAINPEIVTGFATDVYTSRLISQRLQPHLNSLGREIGASTNRCTDVESRYYTMTGQAIQFAFSVNMTGVTEDAHVSA